MKFNGSYIKRAAELYVGATVSDEDVIMIINEALESIGDNALYTEIVVINAENVNSFYDLPKETTSINYVTKDDKPYSDWTSDGTRIKFANQGSYNVHINRMVPLIDNLDDEVKIHPLFHTAIVAYVRGFLKLMDDDQSQDGLTQMQLFNNGVALAHKTLSELRKRVK